MSENNVRPDRVIDVKCTHCTLGCKLRIESRDGDLLSVSGNDCPMGEEYAKFILLMED